MYGTILISLLDKNGTARLGFKRNGGYYIDEYNFEHSPGRPAYRNVTTGIGRLFATQMGTEKIRTYNIWGIGNLNQMPVWRNGHKIMMK